VLLPGADIGEFLMSIEQVLPNVVMWLALAIVSAPVSSASRLWQPQPEAKPEAKPAAQEPKAQPPAQGPKPQSPSQDQPPQSVAPRQQREPALGGYCPAAYLLLGKAVKGDPAFQSTFAGELYYLSGEDAKKQFDADPERFLPRFNGLCTTALGGSYGNRLPSNPEVFDVVDGKVYLFSSERAKHAYQRGPNIYITNASVRFSTPALDSYCPVSYQERNRPIKGGEEFTYRYRSSVYQFANEDAMASFIANPEKYLPQYDGFCADGVFRGKRFAANPENFAIFNGKTYLFFDAKAQIEFQIDLMDKIKKADENWPTMQKEEATRIREMLDGKKAHGD
jgi:YHS domain-containing protein